MRKRLLNSNTLFGFGTLILAIIPFFQQGATMSISLWILVGVAICLILYGMLKPTKTINYLEAQNIMLQRQSILPVLKQDLENYIANVETIAMTDSRLYDLEQYKRLYIKDSKLSLLARPVTETDRICLRLFSSKAYLDNVLYREIKNEKNTQALLAQINRNRPNITDRKLCKYIDGVIKAGHLAFSYIIFIQLFNKVYEQTPEYISKLLERKDSMVGGFNTRRNVVNKRINELLNGVEDD